SRTNAKPIRASGCSAGTSGRAPRASRRVPRRSCAASSRCSSWACRGEPETPDAPSGAPVLADTTAMTRPGRARVRTLFLRRLGVVFVLAFWPLGRQVLLLYGAHGLLPACPVAAQVPVTLFRFACSDRLLWWGTVAGATLGAGLAAGLAPRWLLGAAWLLYLSYVGIGQEFLSFQWDNLLLESSFFALFVTPSGWRLRDAPPPHPLGVFLMQWLLFR